MSIEAIRAALEAVQDPCPEGFDEDTPHDVRAFIAMGSRRNAIRAFQDACNPSAIRALLDRLEAAEKKLTKVREVLEDHKEVGAAKCL